MWATDFVTLQGEWTIYTAFCKKGTWEGASCTGSLAPSARYRFRALKAHREVLFWTAGESGESGRYTRCEIQDGRNWFCPATESPVRAITHRMIQGNPQPDSDAGAIAFHRIPKWKWEMLSLLRPEAGQAPR